MFKKLTLAGCALLFAVGFAIAQEEQETMSATGRVKAVTADALTITADGEDWTFVVDSDTKVVAKGATHKMMEAKAGGKKTQITDFVKKDQQVIVDYHEMDDGKLHAAEIRVR